MNDTKDATNKPRPYPFKASLEQGTVKSSIDIIYIDVTGFIARLGAQFVHVGGHYQVVLELPILHLFVNSPVRVLKTYDRAKESKGPNAKVERMAEFHFEKLSDDHRSRIVQFAANIGQTK